MCAGNYFLFLCVFNKLHVKSQRQKQQLPDSEKNLIQNPKDIWNNMSSYKSSLGTETAGCGSLHVAGKTCSFLKNPSDLWMFLAAFN